MEDLSEDGRIKITFIAGDMNVTTESGFIWLE
jgi:hypothetical protein